MWMVAGHSATTLFRGSRHDAVANSSKAELPSDGGHLPAPVNRDFLMCPMQMKPKETGMLSVKKKHPLGGSFLELRRP
jgi:hypothetical protein